MASDIVGSFCSYPKQQSGSDRSEFRVRTRRLFVIMIRMSYRWICNHPFLLGFVGFLYFLHRVCPLLFSPLVTASPVLVCTFVLLGTILSFGEPNIPEIEKEPETETVHEAALFRTEVSRDDTVVERGDKSFTVESFVSTEKDVVEEGIGDAAADRLGENQLSEVEDESRSFDYRPLIDETLDEVKRDTQVKFEEKAFVLESEKRGEKIEETLIENGGIQVSGAENSGSLDEMMDDSKDDQVDVSPVSPWRPMRHDDDEDDDADRDDSLDSGSDGAESSSPDASMTDIIPMLDELHPLLHSEAPSRGIADGEGSDASSEGPHRSSSDEGMESDVDSESHGEEGDNENEEEEEDEEEEEETKEDKDDESKSAIKWTEADQKNVMDLGSLELERNQRLENLIARRRARHNMRLMAERNLIDFDSADIPFNMPPISTARQNPFDVPYDPYDDVGPIPGSAPSIMFARRNPFDLPYEPNEEKPDLKGDGFQEEFSSQQPKDPVFRRHESFSVGPSTLGGPRHDRLRPFFVLERLANEGTSYYPFERQLSEVSESKVSSVPDTESVCTVLEDDEKKVSEHDTDRETETAKVDMASDHDDEKSHSASDHDDEKSHSASDHDEEKSHSSEDSDFDEQADIKNLHHDVAEIILGRAETHHEPSNLMEGETSDKRKLDEEDYSDSDSSLSEIEEKIPDISENEEMLISEREVDLLEESGTSPLPSFGELEIHGARGVEDDYQHDEARVEESFITAHPSLDESAIQELCRLVDGHHEHHEEPVYDSSPPSASSFPSFSSVSSDHKPDLPGKNGEEVQENEDKEEHEIYSESIGPEEIHSTSDETETRTREVGETSTHVTGEASLFVPEVGIDSRNNSNVSRSAFEDALLDPSSLPLHKNENADHQKDSPLSVSSEEDLEELHKDTRALDVSASSVDLVSPTEEEVVSTGMVEQHLPIEHTSSPLGYDDTREHVTTLEGSPDVVHDIAETSVNRSVAEGIMHEEEEAQQQKDEASPQTFNADIPIDSYATLSSGAVEYVETHSFNDEDPVQSSVPDGKEETHPNQTLDIEVDSVNASTQNVGSEETTPSRSDRELTWSDKSVVEQSSLEPDEDQVPTRAGPVSVVFSRNITFHEYHDAPEDTAELSCLTSDTSSSPVESPEYTTPMVGEGSRAGFFNEEVYEELGHVVERLDQLTDLHTISQSPPEVITEEADEIKEIDEGLLSELDTIGDFNIKEVMTDSEPEPSSIGPDTANEVTEALPVLEARSVEDIDSAFQQIHEGSEVDDVILPSTVQDQLAQENYGNSTETYSDLEVVEATSKEDLDNAMNQAVVESMDKQLKSPESKETNVPLNNTPEKEEEEEEEESRSKEITTSDVSSMETQSLEEIPKPSEPKEGMATEAISERVVIPAEATGTNNVTLSDEVVTEKVKAETASNTDRNVQSPESKETPQNSEESIAEKK